VSDDNELSQIYCICALSQNLSLRTFLATLFQEVPSILKIVHHVISRQCLRWMQSFTITGKHVPNTTLGNSHQSHAVNRILEWH
jgi:hypothetical protein